MEIVPAGDDDLQLLAPRIAAQPLFQRYERSADALLTSWQRAANAGQSFLAARQNASPVALCWYTGNTTFGNGAYLRLIAVVPDTQNAGVGSSLLKAFESACAAAAGGWFLLVADFNTAAQRFYGRHGYGKVGELPNFAAQGIAEYIFWKPPRSTPAVQPP